MNRVMIFLFSFPWLIWAQTPSPFLLESQLEKRIYQMIGGVDPKAQVYINIKYTRKEAPLPGTTINTLDIVDTNQNIELFQQIEFIKISIFTSLDSFPRWLRNQIQTSFQGRGLKSAVFVRALDSETKKIALTKPAEFNPFENFADDLVEKVAQKINPEIEGVKSSAQKYTLGIEKTIERIQENARDLGIFVAAGVFGFVAFVFIFVWYQQYQIRKQLRAINQTLAENNAFNSARPVEAAPQKGLLENPSPPSLTSNGTSPLSQISQESLLALFTDCYWTETDDYGAWIWQHLEPGQRSEILESIPWLNDYAKMVDQKNPKNLGLDRHPSYLNSLNLSDVSQSDLKEWLKENKAAWHHLTPLRQLHITLPIAEKLEYIQSEAVDRKNITPPLPSLKKREIQSQTDVVHLSDEDEENVCQQPDLVPHSLRKQVPSLVWLSLREPQFIEELFSKISAEELATAWVGPASVLKKLEECIPDKKRALLTDYKKSRNPSRGSQTFQLLFEQSLKDDDKDQSDELAG